MRFKNGEQMKCAEETTYLGASITKPVDRQHEIRKRISATMAVLKKLDVFWLKANCNKKWEDASLQRSHSQQTPLRTRQSRAH